MTRVKPAVVLWVLALWILATNHCRIEGLPGGEFLDCCGHSECQTPATQTATPSPPDCNCLALEQSLYKSESDSIRIAQLLSPAHPSCISMALFETAQIPSLKASPLETGPPLERIQSLNFLVRTAGLPRAPSSLN